MNNRKRMITMKVIIGISSRHVHLTKKHLEILFGTNYSLEVLKPIRQPGQYAAVETVTLKTENAEIPNVRIIGPLREYTQVEISKTDAHYLGIDPPIRESGDIRGSEKITIIGPKGEVNLKEGCIIATRHIHMNPRQVVLYGLENRKTVDVLVGREKKSILKDVSLKISNPAYYEMHLDMDDANANGLQNGDVATILLEKKESSIYSKQ